MSNQEYSILLIDDHDIIIKALSEQIAAVFDNIDIICVQSEEEALAVLKENNITLVVTDLSLEGFLSAVTLPQYIHENYPHIKIIVFSMHHEVSIIRTLYDTGINAYVAKSSSTNEVVIAINKALAQQIYYPDNINDLLNKDLHNKSHSVFFSRRENQIIKLIAEGKKTSQISKKLRISVNTVESHRKNIYQKTGSSNMAELVRFAIIHGIIEL